MSLVLHLLILEYVKNLFCNIKLEELHEQYKELPCPLLPDSPVGSLDHICFHCPEIHSHKDTPLHHARPQIRK